MYSSRFSVSLFNFRLPLSLINCAISGFGCRVQSLGPKVNQPVDVTLRKPVRPESPFYLKYFYLRWNPLPFALEPAGLSRAFLRVVHLRRDKWTALSGPLSLGEGICCPLRSCLPPRVPDKGSGEWSRSQPGQESRDPSGWVMREEIPHQNTTLCTLHTLNRAGFCVATSKIPHENPQLCDLHPKSCGIQCGYIRGS